MSELDTVISYEAVKMFALKMLMTFRFLMIRITTDHKVSSLVKSHQNTHNSVKYEVI